MFRRLRDAKLKRSAAATKRKKTIEIMPFMVKKAAFMRRISVGRDDEMFVEQESGHDRYPHPGNAIRGE